MLAALLRKIEMPEELYSLEFVLFNSPLAFSHKFAESIAALKAKMAILLSAEEKRIDVGLTDLDRLLAKYYHYDRFREARYPGFTEKMQKIGKKFERENQEANRLTEERHLHLKFEDLLFQRAAGNFDTMGAAGQLFQDQGLPELKSSNRQKSPIVIKKFRHTHF
jgi:hypothetical protein